MRFEDAKSGMKLKYMGTGKGFYDLKPGALGEVELVDPADRTVLVQMRGYGSLWFGLESQSNELSLTQLEPLSQVEPAPPPVPALCGARHSSGHVCRREVDHANDHDSHPGTNDGVAWMRPAGDMRQAAQQSTQQGLGGEPPTAELEQRNETIRQQNKQIGELEAALKEATGSKLRVGDITGERDRLKLDVARLETDLAFWKREAVRLKGGRR